MTIGEPPARDDDFVPQPECVAVGSRPPRCARKLQIALRAARPLTVRPRPPQFPTHGRQPGWDGESFGYHGDDGRAFTARDRSRRSSAPSLASATSSAAVLAALAPHLFTKNGAFVGAPFVAEPQQLPLHAVVGLDARAPVSFNFGLRPFRFAIADLPPKVHAKPSRLSLPRALCIGGDY